MSSSRPCADLAAWPDEQLSKLLAPNQYLDCGDYWLSGNPQGSPEWLAEREYRITGTRFAAAAELDRFKSRAHLLDLLCGKSKEFFTDQQRADMDRGSKLEPVARRYYEQSRGLKVSERGIMIPKWNPWIGVSIDGDVLGTPGIIEIKCPRRMYAPLVRYNCKRQAQPNLNPADYIWSSHYCQIQGNLAVSGKEWCDYVVYVAPDKETNTSGACGIYRVNFDPHFWNNVLYPKVEECLKLHKNNLAPEMGRSIIPQNVLSMADLRQLYQERHEQLTARKVNLETAVTAQIQARLQNLTLQNTDSK